MYCFFTPLAPGCWRVSIYVGDNLQAMYNGLKTESAARGWAAKWIRLHFTHEECIPILGNA